MDGSVCPQIGRFTFATVLRDDRGRFIMGLIGYFKAILPFKFLKALALREALIWLHDSHVFDVCFETDAKVMIDVVQVNLNDWSEFGQVVDDLNE